MTPKSAASKQPFPASPSSIPVPGASEEHVKLQTSSWLRCGARLAVPRTIPARLVMERPAWRAPAHPSTCSPVSWAGRGGFTSPSHSSHPFEHGNKKETTSPCQSHLQSPSGGVRRWHKAHHCPSRRRRVAPSTKAGETLPTAPGSSPGTTKASSPTPGPKQVREGAWGDSEYELLSPRARRDLQR